MQEFYRSAEEEMAAKQLEEEAKQRMLAAMDGASWAAVGDPSPVLTRDEGQREKEETRKRMLAMMGTSSAGKLRKGVGTAFGFGGDDDENYGYGQEEAADEMDLLTGKPLDGPAQLGDGFDGRSKGWSRRVDKASFGPPPMANTLRTPGQVLPPPYPEEVAMRQEEARLEKKLRRLQRGGGQESSGAEGAA